MSEWQPIETAPRDGTNIQLWWPAEFHAPVTGHWNTGKWSNAGIGWKLSGWGDVISRSEPTHWMLLPKAPKA
jgi:hypothetical protein